MNKILDKILVWLIYRKWIKLYKEFSKPGMNNQEYCIRRRVYDHMIMELKMEMNNEIRL